MGLLLVVILIYLIYTINQKDEEIKKLKKYVNSIRKENETLREYVRKVVNTGEIPESIDVVREETIKQAEKVNVIQNEVIKQRQAEEKPKVAVKVKEPINIPIDKYNINIKTHCRTFSFVNFKYLFQHCIIQLVGGVDKMKSAVLGLLRKIADTKKEEVKLPLIFIGCGGRI